MNWLILLDATDTGGGEGFNYSFFLVLGLIGVVFYFLMIRPQKKQKQQHRQMLDSLGKNDKIVTIGGIHGTVVSVKENYVILKIAENSDVNIRVNRSAIGAIVSPDAGSEEA